ncbi:MAG TPA: hypothetical protein DEG44_03345 [Candidatus Kerfeldbacteria bacterium]|nr:hypothetical protein [Candidatus Kerfeldbacteria bacterium]
MDFSSQKRSAIKAGSVVLSAAGFSSLAPFTPAGTSCYTEAMFWKITGCVAILSGIILSQEAAAAVFSEDLIDNGKFESGFTFWNGTNVNDSNLDDQYPIDGDFVTLGQYSQTQAISQTVVVPNNAGLITLSFWYRLYTSDTTANDTFTITFTKSDTGEVLLSDTMPASDGAVTDWEEYTLDASAIRGETVIVTLAVKNDASLFTFVDVDTIRLKAQSYGELVGTVVGASGTKLRNAEVTIRTPKNKKIWTGETNKKGKFMATLLPGKSGKYKITIKKSGETFTGRAKIAWAKQTKKTFTIPNV